MRETLWNLIAQATEDDLEHLVVLDTFVLQNGRASALVELNAQTDDSRN